MIIRICPIFLLLTGCASLDNVVGGIANTPEWFQERRVEIRGEGYPEIAKVPVALPLEEAQERMEVSGVEAENARQLLARHPRSAASPYTPQELASRMDTARAGLPDLAPKPDGHISPEEIDALRRQLEVPPRR